MDPAILINLSILMDPVILMNMTIDHSGDFGNFDDESVNSGDIVFDFVREFVSE